MRLVCYSGELGGVWQYRQAGEEEELSLNGEDGDEEDNTDADSVLSSPIPTDTNVGIFDAISPEKPPNVDASVGLFDPLSEQKTPESPAASGVSNLWLLSSLKEDDVDSTSSSDHPKFHVGDDGIESGKGDLLVSPVPETSASLPQNASPRRLAKPSSLLNLDLQVMLWI